MKELNKHPVHRKFEEKHQPIEYNYCPGCEIEYYMTKAEFMKHLEKHKKIAGEIDEEEY